MKREDIKKLFPNATDDQIDRVMNLHSADVGTHKNIVAALTIERDQLKEELAEAIRNDAIYIFYSIYRNKSIWDVDSFFYMQSIQIIVNQRRQAHFCGPAYFHCIFDYTAKICWFLSSFSTKTKGYFWKKK